MDRNTLSDFFIGGYLLGEMQPKPDAQLLREYAETGAEPAFTEIVQRHTNLVYSAALRQVESPEVAAEIAQKVFIGLARGARALCPKLTGDASLAGWLCRSARNLSLNFRRDEFRRQSRERQAMEQLSSIPDAAPDWERLRLVLDDAMSELSERHYDALVLRFFENRDFRSVGQALGVTDDAAQKCVSRALEKLREHFSRRNINTTAAALSVAISANAIQAAPVGLAASISTGAGIAATTLASAGTATVTKVIAMTTFQKAIVSAAVIILAGAGIYEARQNSKLQKGNQALLQQQVSLNAQVGQLQRERDDGKSRLASLMNENENLRQGSVELLKLRGETAALREKLSQFEQTGSAKVPDAESASANMLSFAMDEARRSATNAVLDGVRAMQEKIGLTLQQAQAVREIRFKNIDARTRMQLGELTGNLSAEDRNSSNRLFENERSEISAVLSPEQRAAYEQMKEARVRASAEHYGNNAASEMARYLNLTEEQQSAVASVLSTFGPQNALAPDAQSQLEARLQALEPILTPEQLQTYRQRALATIEQAQQAASTMKLWFGTKTPE